MLEFNESYNKRDIELPVGEVFTIRLPENPTTGFRWDFASNGEPTCTLLDNFYKRASNRFGAGGSHAWEFRVTQTGHGKIELVYRQPWEQEKMPAQTFTLDISTFS